MTNKRGYHHQNVPHENKIRVRGKRLDQVDNTKLTLAFWLLAKQLVEDKTDVRTLSEPEVRRVMERLDSTGPEEAAKPPQTAVSGGPGEPTKPGRPAAAADSDPEDPKDPKNANREEESCD